MDLMIMDAKMRDFLYSRKMHTELENKTGKNPALNWKTLRNPFRVAINAAVIYLSMFIPSPGIKRSLYRALGAKIGDDVVISPEVFIDPFFPELVEIGDNSIIGWGTKILTHEYTEKNTRIGRVVIGKNVMVGAFSVVRCGVSIGDDAVVAMMSLVNKTVGNSETVGGVPEHEINKRRKQK